MAQNTIQLRRKTHSVAAPLTQQVKHAERIKQPLLVEVADHLGDVPIGHCLAAAVVAEVGEKCRVGLRHDRRFVQPSGEACLFALND